MHGRGRGAAGKRQGERGAGGKRGSGERGAAGKRGSGKGAGGKGAKGEKQQQQQQQQQAHPAPPKKTTPVPPPPKSAGRRNPRLTQWSCPRASGRPAGCRAQGSRAPSRRYQSGNLNTHKTHTKHRVVKTRTRRTAQTKQRGKRKTPPHPHAHDGVPAWPMWIDRTSRMVAVVGGKRKARGGKGVGERGGEAGKLRVRCNYPGKCPHMRMRGKNLSQQQKSPTTKISSSKSTARKPCLHPVCQQDTRAKRQEALRHERMRRDGRL